MKTQLNKLALTLCITGFIAIPAMAATDTSTDSTQTNTVTTVKHKHVRVNRKHVLAHTKHNATGYVVLPTHASSTVTSAPLTNSEEPASSDVVPTNKKITGKDIVRILSEETDYLPFDLDVPGQAFVSTGPYIGVPIQFAGTNLIINSPSVNTDLQLLGIRKNIITQLNLLGNNQIKEAYHSHLLLSGVIEGQAGYINHSGVNGANINSAGVNNGGNPASYIDVTNLTLDFTVLGPSDWLTGFAELTYDNSPPNGSQYTSTSNYTVSNSRILVNKAFITIGDLAVSPIYGTFGQFYVPFGVYSSVMVSDPISKTLGRTKARALELGYSPECPNTFYASAFVFKGDAHDTGVNRINNGGINFGYKFNHSIFSGTVGASAIADLADSAGMQIGTGIQTFENIRHKVPAYNVRGNVGIGSNWDVIAEVVGAAQRFSPADMTYSNHGAKPWALDTEVSYSFTILDQKPSAIGIGYEHSAQALAMGIPQNRYSLVFNTSLLRNTLQSLEIRHDREYASSIAASGAGGVVSTVQTGKSDNAVTAQFDLYF